MKIGESLHRVTVNYRNCYLKVALVGLFLVLGVDTIRIGSVSLKLYDSYWNSEKYIPISRLKFKPNLFGGIVNTLLLYYKFTVCDLVYILHIS